MRHLLLAALLVAMTGCGSDTKPEVQAAPVQPTTPAETVSSPETPNGSDEPSPKAGVPVVNSIGMRFVPIQAGTFTMGDSNGDYDEAPHQVTLTQSFHLGQHEVTQEQYEKVMGAIPPALGFATSPPSLGIGFKGPQNPVEKVSWDDAVEFCRKLSELPEEKSGVYRLPTEAEWEYSCRAGTTTKYSFGDDASKLEQYAWYDKNSDGRTHPVGQKKPNPWGLYDMHGNVWEWCQDGYGAYPSGAVTDPTGVASRPAFGVVGADMVRRGGSWFYNSGSCRSAIRVKGSSGSANSLVGFRVVRSSIK